MDRYKTRINENEAISFFDRDAWRGDSYSILESQFVDEYNANGFAVIKGAFETIPKKYETICCEYKCIDPASGKVRSMLGVHNDEEVSRLFFGNSFLYDLAEEILDDEVYIHQSRINCKTKGNIGWSWHSDFETWHAQDGMPEMRAFTAMVAMSKNTKNNGPLVVIPGSHKWYWSAPKSAEFSANENFQDQKEGVPCDDAIKEIMARCGTGPLEVILEPGDMLIFDCNLMHSSVDNVSEEIRTNIYFVFNAKSNGLVEPFSHDIYRPNYMAERGVI